MLWEHCKSTIEAKGFVGLRKDKNGFNAYFPLGYRLPKDDKAALQDILLLMRVLEAYSPYRLGLSRHLSEQLIREIKTQKVSDKIKIGKGYKYGVQSFAAVWEFLVTTVYASTKAHYYYPECFWEIQGEKHMVGRLRPDCIHVEENNKQRVVTVIDAKYYKFGITGEVHHLPKASDIQKQITYGEYLAKTMEPAAIVQNIFVLPYEACGEGIAEVFGWAKGSWKKGNHSYTNIIGMLVDTKWLCKKAFKRDKGTEVMDATISC